MIDFLEGRLAAKAPTHATLEAHGVGFHLHIPLSTFEALPAGGSVHLHTHLHVQQDALRLFGFATTAERDCFRLLIGISGVGPSTAIGILSGCSVPQLAAAISTGDEAILRRIKGVGPKTAQRLIVELRDSRALKALPGTGEPPAAVDALAQDAVLALISLGHTPAAAEQAVRAAMAEIPPGRPVGEIVRKALQATVAGSAKSRTK